jgi:hypothetical protein
LLDKPCWLAVNGEALRLMFATPSDLSCLLFASYGVGSGKVRLESHFQAGLGSTKNILAVG